MVISAATMGNLKGVMKTPVAFIIFNRPDTTRQVFEQIRAAQPPKLFVIADGPRGDRPAEAEKCRATRNIIESVDWDCDVFTNYSEINLGCKKRVSSGLNWVFEQVEEAIILEDDCLPNASFFPFCEQLLEKYRHQPQVMHISGDNFQLGQRRTEYSYYFSIYNHCWGWATWRRAWQEYDITMQQLQHQSTKHLLKELLGDWLATQYWWYKFQRTAAGKIDTWDYQWTFSCWLNQGLSILPTVNLVSNIGFNVDGTHTKKRTDLLANLPVESLNFPLVHPPKIEQHKIADNFTQSSQFGLRPILSRKLKSLLPL